MAHILGISAFYHDSSVTLVTDGHIVFAAQEERFTRKKHDSSFPVNAIRHCLENCKLKAEDIGYIAFYEKPFIKFGRLIKTYLAYTPRGIKSFIKAIPVWTNEKIWIKDIIQRQLDFNGKIIFPEHHLSHAASAFFPSPFREAAFLTIDGAGEWATATIGIGKDNKVQILEDMSFPHSLGLLYSAFTYYLGFKVNSDEYKVMGLASYGKPKYKELILSEVVDLKKDGSFKLNMKYFNYCTGLTMTNRNFDKLFGGPPRKPETDLGQRHADLARS